MDIGALENSSLDKTNKSTLEEEKKEGAPAPVELTTISMG
jgi:hypothetical protein